MAAGITRITIEGYKSIRKEQSIEIAPLTILAGANSSGKSSMIQPLLLLKQTIEAPWNPGPLMINGSILKFTSTDQFMTGKEGRSRFLRIAIEVENGSHWSVSFLKQPNGTLSSEPTRWRLGLSGDSFPFEFTILRTIHVSGQRENLGRYYPIASVEEPLLGPFESYVGSIVESWHSESGDLALAHEIQHLGLGAGGIRAARVDETKLELTVQMTERQDFFNIADVGRGISDALPVLVALRLADIDQMVYIEQPELHLHPRAEVRMADILLDAARRGVRVVVETHGSLLLRAIQTLVAQQKLRPDLVRLHWFSRDKRGVTHIESACMDENGAFGNWPEDFGDVILDSEREYLDAVEARVYR